MLVRKGSKVCRKESKTRKLFKRVCEGISDSFWKQIETDYNGHWYWDGKKIHRDDFWDFVWELFKEDCEEKGLDPDDQDFDAWAESEDLDGYLQEIFYNAGQEYVDYDLDHLRGDLKEWLRDNIAGEVITKKNLKSLDWEDLKNILDKAQKLKDVENLKIKYTSLKDIQGKLKDIIDDCGEVEFNNKVESDHNYDGYYCIGYGTDGTSMYELSIDLHD